MASGRRSRRLPSAPSRSARLRRATAPGGRPRQTGEWSYFSRRTDAETFTREALGELHRRGTCAAGTVVAPVDGSAWCQGFYDMQRPDAVRILDFPHAGEHLSAPVRAIWGRGSTATQAWLDTWLSQLKTGDPADVLEALCLLPTETAARLRRAAAVALRDASVEYLAGRWDQIQDAVFLGAGYPIGSGSVESANKLVVEVRLKGSGLHWARPHVDPMLALRNLVCHDRWAEAWPEMVQDQRRAVARLRRAATHPSPATPRAGRPRRATHARRVGGRAAAHARVTGTLHRGRPPHAGSSLETHPVPQPPRPPSPAKGCKFVTRTR